MERRIGIAALLAAAVAASAWTPASAAGLMAAGGGHTCLANPGGKTYCWGWQEQGQVGDGSFDYSIAAPREIAGAFDAVAVDAGYQHTCAALGDGSVSCWGYDRWGAVGDGPAGGAIAPHAVLGLSHAVDVGAGAYFSCALLEEGTVKCWGLGNFYQLGNGQAIETDAPTVAAQDIAGATALAVGGEFACVIVDGKVKCWGRNHVGQLGRGTLTPDADLDGSVADVSGIDDALAIAAGYNHACAIVDGGAVRCWGSGSRGKLGDDTGNTSPLPVAVQDLGGAAVAIDAGDEHTCAILESGAMKCWGYNFQGTLGNGQAPTDALKATTVVGIGDVSAMAAGGAHTCARTKVSPLEVWCWGAGSFGQLGNGQIGGTVQANTPVRVIGAGFDTVFGGAGAARTGGFE